LIPENKTIAQEILGKFDKAQGHLKDTMSDIGILPFEFETDFEELQPATMMSILKVFDSINYCHSVIKYLKTVVAANLLVSKKLSAADFLEIAKNAGFDVETETQLKQTVSKILKVEGQMITKEHNGNPVYGWMLEHDIIKEENGKRKTPADQMDLTEMLQNLQIDLP
jgi:hypothetical protein